MKHFCLGFCLISAFSFSQNLDAVKYRFSHYLNYHNQLSNAVKFDTKAVYMFNTNGSKQCTFYKEELSILGEYFETCSSSQITEFIKMKANKNLNTHQLDSLKKLVTKQNQTIITETKPLSGIKIAIDPGHFGTNLKDAAAEQKYLKIVDANQKDTIIIFESLLSFQTAYLVKSQLEEKGATVFLTRTQANYTSFNCSFDDWIKLYKNKTLDSLLKTNQLNLSKYKQLKSANNYKFFWDFFREYELANRAKKINDFQPDITLIIHYNVNEKNVPWKKTSDKNFTMTFIAGAFTRNDLQKTDSKANFVRLLLSHQLNRSEKLASLTVNHFSKQLNIPIARPVDATYLEENCLAAASEGVYSRNLFLCRKVNSVLVYGESLYQDNELEIHFLHKNNLNINGILTSTRVQQVAKCYFDAVMDYFK